MWCCRQTHVQERETEGPRERGKERPAPARFAGACDPPLAPPAQAAARAPFSPRAVLRLRAKQGGRTGPHRPCQHSSHLPRSASCDESSVHPSSILPCVMTHVRQLALAGENGTIGRDVLVLVACSCRVVSCRRYGCDDFVRATLLYWHLAGN